ncbi:MAG: anaerobic C4-dicarboxylate transporter, partial [Arcanobacterium sp.]|nr:anaerobic C4-dicarboxylate transporter [Arcanobacterium sp.]
MAFQFLIVLIFIFIGARFGSLGIGLAGGAGVAVLALTGLKVDYATGIPWEVLGIIVAVIMCISTMQTAGGLDYLVMVTERLLRKNPKRITFYGPIVTFFMTVFCGTGHVAFSSLPVIAEVAKETGVRPSRPLSISVVASQVAIAASPISAAMIAMTAVVEPLGVSYVKLLAVMIPITFIGCMVGALVASKLGVELEDDPVYQERKKAGLVKLHGEGVYNIKPRAKVSVWIFGIALLLVIVYALAISKSIHLIPGDFLPRSSAIMTFMMLAGLIIAVVCKVDTSQISSQSTFRGGMSAAACILGVAWLGNTFVNSYTDEIKAVGGSVVTAAPWLLAVVLFFASALLYSQGATTATLMPVAAALGVSAGTMVASFAAVTGLYLLPTYPTTVAAVEIDDTGSTRIGKYVFNHPFIIPGVVSVSVAVVL